MTDYVVAVFCAGVIIGMLIGAVMSWFGKRDNPSW